jgi:ATP-dependent helicase/nuclease subunit A
MINATETQERAKLSVDIIGASAGTGKTTRLSTEFVNAVTGHDGKKPIDPLRIIVCTFTNKAADELCVRIRQKLIKAGNRDAAQLVLAGYVGTVNGICGRLLKDYSLECGLSPEQNVIPEHMQESIFSMASAEVLDAFAQRIEPLAERLSFNETVSSAFRKKTHWMEHVRRISSLARSNGMSADMLRFSAKTSWQGMQKHFPQVDISIDFEQMTEALALELEDTLHEMEQTTDTTLDTQKALDTLRECASHARREALTWRDWAALSKLSPGASSRPLVKNVLAICKALPHHDRLHKDLEEYIYQVFECAAESLEAYQEYKSENGLVDFVDQEYLALKLLDNPTVIQSLRSRIELALIDEFQDTSPIQLALFLKLAAIVNHSIWVGDVKQAIYGFRGTDPQLMQRASENFNRCPPLEDSYRSRPELVHFSNELFRRVFPSFGIAEQDVVIRGKRSSAPAGTIELWRCDGKNLSDCFSALAQGINEFLTRNQPTQIDDPHTGESRRLRGSDIAVLCRKNSHCSELATKLAESGLKVAMTRDGLLQTPECLLAVSTLKYLVDSYDRLALGYIVHLCHDYNNSDQSAWLADWLKSDGKPEKLLPHKAGIEEARTKLPFCTTSDALNLAIQAGRVIAMVEAWGDVPQRLSNLDALRGLVQDYEDTSALAHVPATINGFLCYLEQLDESDQPASVDSDAVQILTYHGAKGLEWPIVILADLDAEAAPKVHKDLCKIQVESGEEAFDLNDPLKGRWIRFWPWPFGSIEKDGTFEQSAVNSVEFKDTALRLRSENARLMYVGITRSRDLLILAPYTGRTQNKVGTQWLDELHFDERQILSMPQTAGESCIMVGDSEHRTTVRIYAAAESNVHVQMKEVYAPAKSLNASRAAWPTYRVRPSALSSKFERTEDDAQPTIHDIGERIPFSGKVDMSALGECVHRFLAADSLTDSQTVRLELAEGIRKNWSIDQITNEDLIVMADRLHAFLKSTFGDVSFYAECPVIGRLENQRLRGVIDLLVETNTHFHIIDHKTFPGALEQWTSKAISYRPQLLAYKHALSQLNGKPVGRLLVHMPMVGKIVELGP